MSNSARHPRLLKLPLFSYTVGFRSATLLRAHNGLLTPLFRTTNGLMLTLGEKLTLTSFAPGMFVFFHGVHVDTDGQVCVANPQPLEPYLLGLGNPRKTNRGNHYPAGYVPADYHGASRS